MQSAITLSAPLQKVVLLDDDPQAVKTDHNDVHPGASVPLAVLAGNVLATCAGQLRCKRRRNDQHSHHHTDLRVWNATQPQAAKGSKSGR